MGLNARQVEVLRWIAAGSPEREWPDWTHRTTAKALQSRGLVSVRGRGPTWTAEVTELGRRVAAGEELPSSRGRKAPAGKQKQSPVAVESNKSLRTDVPEIDPADLIVDLTEADGQVITVPDPARPLRAAYRRALAALPKDLVPTNKRVTFSGRDRGDLTIRLVDEAVPAAPDPAVTVPSELDSSQSLIAWLVRHPEVMDVSDTSRDRALRVIQGITESLATRGHAVARHRVPDADEGVTYRQHSGWGSRHVATKPPEPATVEVRIGDQVLLVDLIEEREKVKNVPESEAAAAKYEWQRLRPVESNEFSGRLALRVRGFAPSQGWADRKRWTLESRLPRFVRNLEEEAQRRDEARIRVNEAKRQRRREWEEALPKARAAYLRVLNRERLDKQVAAYSESVRLAAYADAVAARAKEFESEQREAPEAWADWIRGEARRLDPTGQRTHLQFQEPKSISPWELDRYMPGGLRASAPPEDPDASGE